MKKTFRIPVVLLVALGFLFALAAFAADPPAAGPGAAPGYEPRRMYDPKTVETVGGEVVKVDKIRHRRGAGYGVHLVLKTEKEEIPVHLGPSFYLDKQDVKIGEKDKVEVKGSRVTLRGGKAVILAAEVKKGDALLKLRDEDGTPAWSRRKTR
jgi:hypothetical protein